MRAARRWRRCARVSPGNAVSPGAIRTELIAALLGDDLGWVNAQCIEVAGGYLI